MSGQSSSPTIVITGAGLVCALGSNKERAWAKIVRGECGIGPLRSIEQPLPGGGDGGEAGTDIEFTRLREIVLLRRAVDEALREAGIAGDWPCPSDRVSIILGTTLGGMRAAGRFLRSGDLAEMREFTAASILHQATRHWPPTGLSATTCAACASGLSSISLGLTLLRDGSCDLVLAGGYDPISEYAWAGFNSLRLVTDEPPRPFSRDRKGMKLGEGYGVVVLERRDVAERRQASALAVVAGFGESSDAHHLTQPEPTGEGASRAMLAAMADAGIEPSAIGLIAAHATATPNNDAAEFAAYQRVFGERLSDVPVVAFKSHLGHTLGGAGAVELILSLMAMRERTIPPMATVTRDEIEFPGLNVVMGRARTATLDYTLNLSMGFGGANACVILANAENDKSLDAHGFQSVGVNSVKRFREVFITGVGVLMPGAIGNQAFIERLRAGDWQVGCDLEESDFAHLFNTRRARRLSEYVKFMLAATSVALQDAGVADVASFASTCGAILGTTHGPSRYSEDFYRQVVSEGIAAANPLLFAEGVPNAGSAQLSLMLGLKGGTQTIIGSRTAGLDALNLAMRRIADGSCDRLIVGAAEERSELVELAHRDCGETGLASSDCAVALVLESAAGAEARRSRPRGLVLDAEARRINVEGSAGSCQVIEDEFRRQFGEPQHRLPLSFANRLSGMFSASALVDLAAALLNPTRKEGNLAEPDVSVTQCDPLGFVAGVRVRCCPR